VSTAPPPTSADVARGAADARGLGRDFVVTLGAQIAIAAGGLLLYRLIALEKGAEGMASYGLVKQDVLFLFPAAMLGFQMGLPRYIALDRDREGSSERYLVAAVAATGFAAALVSILLLASPGTTAAVLFGDSDRSHLVVPLVTTLLATLAGEVIWGYYRGRSEFLLPSAYRVLCVAALPVALLIAFPSEPIGRLINYMAFGALAGSVVLAARPLARGLRAIELGAVRRSVRTLLDFGYRRVPGEYASVTLMTVPPIVAAHVAPLEEVAFLTAGMYVLAVVTIAFQPVGMVFLPLLSRLCREDFEAARRWVGQLTACALHIAIFLTPQLVLFADVAVRSWLGPDFEDGGTVIRITVLPVALYVFYLVLRSALDAAAITAYNSRNNTIALLAAAIAAAVALGLDVGAPVEAIAASFAVGLSILGILTLGSIRSIFGMERAAFALPLALALSAVGAAIGALIRFAVTGDDPPLGALVGIGAVELALGAAYVAALVRAGVTWPIAIRDRFRSAR
jgi:O-antigen/teichoic acid export membrane protein